MAEALKQQVRQALEKSFDENKLLIVPIKSPPTATQLTEKVIDSASDFFADSNAKTIGFSLSELNSKKLQSILAQVNKTFGSNVAITREKIQGSEHSLWRVTLIREGAAPSKVVLEKVPELKGAPAQQAEKKLQYFSSVPYEITVHPPPQAQRRRQSTKQKPLEEARSMPDYRDVLDNLRNERNFTGGLEAQKMAWSALTQYNEGSRRDAVFFAIGRLGTKYQSGGRGVRRQGFDCSGFVEAAIHAAYADKLGGNNNPVWLTSSAFYGVGKKAGQGGEAITIKPKASKAEVAKEFSLLLSGDIMAYPESGKSGGHSIIVLYNQKPVEGQTQGKVLFAEAEGAEYNRVVARLMTYDELANYMRRGSERKEFSILSLQAGGDAFYSASMGADRQEPGSIHRKT